MRLILSGFHTRCKREREGRAWLATNIAYAQAAEKIPMPWELLGEEDPDVERRERTRKEQEENAHRLIGVPSATDPSETPEEVLKRFGVLQAGDAHAG